MENNGHGSVFSEITVIFRTGSVSCLSFGIPLMDSSSKHSLDSSALIPDHERHFKCACQQMVNYMTSRIQHALITLTDCPLSGEDIIDWMSKLHEEIV